MAAVKILERELDDILAQASRFDMVALKDANSVTARMRLTESMLSSPVVDVFQQQILINSEKYVLTAQANQINTYVSADGQTAFVLLAEDSALVLRAAPGEQPVVAEPLRKHMKAMHRQLTVNTKLKSQQLYDFVQIENIILAGRPIRYLQHVAIYAKQKYAAVIRLTQKSAFERTLYQCLHLQKQLSTQFYFCFQIRGFGQPELEPLVTRCSYAKSLNILADSDRADDVLLFECAPGKTPILVRELAGLDQFSNHLKIQQINVTEPDPLPISMDGDSLIFLGCEAQLSKQVNVYGDYIAVFANPKASKFVELLESVAERSGNAQLLVCLQGVTMVGYQSEKLPAIVQKYSVMYDERLLFKIVRDCFGFEQHGIIGRLGGEVFLGQDIKQFVDAYNKVQQSGVTRQHRQKYEEEIMAAKGSQGLFLGRKK